MASEEEPEVESLVERLLERNEVVRTVVRVPGLVVELEEVSLLARLESGCVVVVVVVVDAVALEAEPSRFLANLQESSLRKQVGLAEAEEVVAVLEAEVVAASARVSDCVGSGPQKPVDRVEVVSAVRLLGVRTASGELDELEKSQPRELRNQESSAKRRVHSYIDGQVSCFGHEHLEASHIGFFRHQEVGQQAAGLVQVRDVVDLGVDAAADRVADRYGVHVVPSDLPVYASSSGQQRKRNVQERNRMCSLPSSLISLS